MPVFKSLMDRSTSLQRLEIELTEKGQEEMVYHTLERKGSMLQELTIDLDKNHEDNLWISSSKAILMADMMRRISELSPTALTSLTFVTNYLRNGPSKFTFTLSEDGGHNLPFSSRILGLSIGSEGKTILYDAYLGWWDTIPRFVAYGMGCHRGNMWSCLELITVENLQLENDITPEDLVEEYKLWLREYNPKLLELYDISYIRKDKTKVVDIIVERISPNDDFGDPNDELGNPERAFRTFLLKIRKVELERTIEYSDGETDNSESEEPASDKNHGDMNRSQKPEQTVLSYRQFISEIYYLFSHPIPSYSFIMPLAITYEERAELPKNTNTSFRQLLRQRFSGLTRAFRKSPRRFVKNLKRKFQ